MPSIGPTIGIKGEREYKAALNRIVKETRQLNTEMQLMQTRFKSTDTQMERNRAITESLTKQMDKQKDAIEKRNELLKASETRYDKYAQKIEDLKKKKEAGIETYTTEKGKIIDVNKELERNQINLERSGQAVADNAQKVAAAELEYEKLKEQLEAIPNVAEIAGEKLQNIGSFAEGVGDKLTQYISAPLAALGAFSIKGASDITDGLAKIYTIADQGVVPMDEMRQGLMGLSDTTARSVTELEAAAYQALSAAIATEDTVGFVEDASNLARAGFLDTAGAVDILTTIINAYHKDAKDAEKISSVLVKTQDDGKTTVAELAHSMGTVIPTAAAYGVSLEQLSSAYVVLTRQGIDTARATTFLNSMFTELEKEGTGVSLVLEEKMGKSFAELMGEGKTVADVMQILMDSVDGNSEEFAKLWGNVRAGRGALAIINGGTELFNTELTKLENSSGQVARNLAILETPSLKARRAFNKLKNSAYDLGQEALKTLLPYFEKGIELVDEFTGWLKSLSKAEKDNILRTAAMVAAAGPLLTIGGKLLIGGGKLIQSFGTITRFTYNTGNVIEGVTGILKDNTLGWARLSPAIGATVAVLGGAYVAYKAITSAHDAEIKKMYELTDEQQQLIDSSKALSESWFNTQAESKETATTIEEQALKAQILKDKYNELIDENGHVKKGHEELAEQIKSELAVALGIERDGLDKLIEKNGMLGASIDEVIRKTKQQALMEAYKDDYFQAIEDRAESQKKLVELNDQMAEADRRVIEAANEAKRAREEERKALDTHNPAWIKYTNARADAEKKEAAARETAEALRNEYNMQVDAYNGMTNTIENYENALKAAEEESEDLGVQIKKIPENFVTAERGSVAAVRQQKDRLTREYKAAAKALADGSSNVTQEMVDELKALMEAADAEYDKLIGPDGRARTKKEMEEFVDKAVVEPAEQGMKKVPATADTGIMKFAEAIKYGIKPARASMQKIIDNLLEVAPSKIKEMENVGWLYGEGFAKGLNRYPIKDTVREWAGHAPGQTSKTLLINSPSKLAMEYGWYWGEGLAIGITKTTGLVSNAAEQLANSATAMDGYLNYSGMNPYVMGGGMSPVSKSVSAPISVSVTVNGNVDNYEELAETIADRINDQIIRKNEVFA